MKKTSNLISAIMTLVVGILCLVLKQGVVTIGLTGLGVVLLGTAVLELVRQNITSGVIKAVLGIAVLIVGYLLMDIALKVIGIVILVYGVLELVKRIVAVVKGQSGKLWTTILGFIYPALCVVAAFFLIVSTGAAVYWAVIVAGVLFIVEGVIALIEAVAAKN